MSLRKLLPLCCLCANNGVGGSCLAWINIAFTTSDTFILLYENSDSMLTLNQTKFSLLYIYVLVRKMYCKLFPEAWFFPVLCRPVGCVHVCPSSPLPQCLWSCYPVSQLAALRLPRCDQPSADRCHRAAEAAVLLRPRSGLSVFYTSIEKLASGHTAQLLRGWDEQSCRQHCCSWTWPYIGQHLSQRYPWRAGGFWLQQ